MPAVESLQQDGDYVGFSYWARDHIKDLFCVNPDRIEPTE